MKPVFPRLGSVVRMLLVAGAVCCLAGPTWAAQAPKKASSPVGQPAWVLVTTVPSSFYTETTVEFSPALATASDCKKLMAHVRFLNWQVDQGQSHPKLECLEIQVPSR
jgi:hypothetical protein